MKKSKLIGAVVILLLLGTVMVGAAAADNYNYTLDIGEGSVTDLHLSTDAEYSTEFSSGSPLFSNLTLDAYTCDVTYNSDAKSLTFVLNNGGETVDAPITLYMYKVDEKLETNVKYPGTLTVEGTEKTTVNWKNITDGAKSFNVIENECLILKVTDGYTLTYASTTYKDVSGLTWYRENTYSESVKISEPATITSGLTDTNTLTVSFIKEDNLVRITVGDYVYNMYLGENGQKYTGTPVISVSLDGTNWGSLMNSNYVTYIDQTTDIYLKVEKSTSLTINSTAEVTLNTHLSSSETPISSGDEVTPGSSVVIEPDVTGEKVIKAMNFKNTYTSDPFTEYTIDANGWYNFTMPAYSLTVSCSLTNGGTSTVTYEADPTYSFTIPSDITLRSVVNGIVGTPAGITANSDFSSDKKIVMRLDTTSDAVTEATPQTNFAVHSTDVSWASNGKYAEYTMAVYNNEELAEKDRTKKITDNQTIEGSETSDNNIIVQVTGTGGSAQQGPSVSKYVGFTTTVLPLIVDADYTGTLTFTVGVEQISS